MKLLDRINLKIFSIIVIIMSFLMILFCFDVIHDFDFLETFKSGNFLYVTVIMSIIFIIMGIKSLFFNGKKENVSDGVLLENSNGKLFITKESIVGMIDVELKNYSEILSYNTNIGFDPEKNLFIELNITIDKNTNIKELSTKLQNSLIASVKRSSDIDVKSIDIKIKNVQDEQINNKK